MIDDMPGPAYGFCPHCGAALETREAEDLHRSSVRDFGRATVPLAPRAPCDRAKTEWAMRQMLED